MTTPRRCLICGCLNEPYASRCSCGASLDVSADESRHVLSRAAHLAAAWAALWAIATLVLVGLMIAFATSPAGARSARLIFLLVIVAFGTLGAAIRSLRAFGRARANLSAIPDLPRAAVRRRT